MNVIDKISIFSGLDLRESNPLLVLDVTDSCTRSASIGGDDMVRIVSNSEIMVELAPLSYIKYNGDYFYLKSVYRPSDLGGGIYLYEVSFYKVDNILDLFIFQRIATVTDKDGNIVTWKEAEFDLNANKKNIGDVVCASIQDSMARLSNYKIYEEIGGLQLANNADYSKSKLIAWSFSGNTIREALDDIANQFECDWWIEDYTLYIEKRENKNNVIVVDDQYTDLHGRPEGNASGGVASISYATEMITRSGRVFPIGSERNIKREQATWNGMNISYNKRLTLRPNTSYPIALADGTTDVLVTDAEGAVVFGDTIGQESVVEFDDVYPKQVFQVTNVTEKQGAEGKSQYLVTCAGTGSVPPEYLNEPIQQAAGVAQTITFESGRLNGFTFDIFLQKGSTMTYRTFDFTIVPQVTDNVYLPSGTLIPQRGDTFALAGIVMPDYYVESARSELAAKAYEAIEQLKRFQPSLRVVLEPTWVYDNIYGVNLGDLAEVTSVLTGSEVYKNRIINYTYSLTFPESITITLAEKIEKGILKEREEALNNVKDGFVRRYNKLDGTYVYVKENSITQSEILTDHGVKLADLDRDVTLFGEIAANTKERVGTLQGFLAGISNSNYRVGYADFSTTSTIEQTEPTMLRVMKGTMTNGNRTYYIPEVYINLEELEMSQRHYIYAIANEGDEVARIVVRDQENNDIMAASASDEICLAIIVAIEDEWQWHYGRGRAISIGDDVQIGSLVTDVDKESLELRRHKDVTVAAKAMYVDRELVLSDKAAMALIERLREFGL